MEDLIRDIFDALRTDPGFDESKLDALLRSYSKRMHDGRRIYAKKRIYPVYLENKRQNSDVFESWEVTDELERRFVALTMMKPRRTESGVATITVITKPWPCSGTCIFCPNDIRMPKSYLHNEPACQRAERAFFDPYIQVASRLRTLEQMGHAVDKVELIVLGGTFVEYPKPYRLWFMYELFRALNDDEQTRNEQMRRRKEAYLVAGLTNDAGELSKRLAEVQAELQAQKITYNEAFSKTYGKSSAWAHIEPTQTATMQELAAEQVRNEQATHRMVGLVVETRPDTIDADELRELRLYGCTKVQIGVQSTRDDVLEENGRNISASRIANSFALLRAFGFKIHAHFMVNLYGMTPEEDIADYRTFAQDERFMPDEVKLYPCALIDGTPLMDCYREGSWRPYTEEELLHILRNDVANTLPFTRISRMIRDISATDIVDGNKKANLRQLVEEGLDDDSDIKEMRFREIRGDAVDSAELALEDFTYETANTTEHFLQWVTPQGKLAGFLRLSLPHDEYIERHAGILPVSSGSAMIREVHVYGSAAKLHATDKNAQHHGLGKALVARACDIAQDAGFSRMNVISAVGTRDYYRSLGFIDGELYQSKLLA